jgi:hypothetical protein
MTYLPVMFKYYRLSPMSIPKKSRGKTPYCYMRRISYALARSASAPPVPRLATGNSRFSPHPYQSSSKTLSGGLAPTRIARRFARPTGLLT